MSIKKLYLVGTAPCWTAGQMQCIKPFWCKKNWLYVSACFFTDHISPYLFFVIF